MGRYAKGTGVAVERSRAEIERLLQRHGADQILIGWERSGHAAITFLMKDRYVRLHLELPERDSKEFNFTPARKFMRNPEQADQAWEQACRERWRALLLVVKAKLEAAESGITSFEEEFLAHFVLPGERKVADVVLPMIAEAYKSGRIPKLLPSFSEPR